jgi:Polyketide cyclase / dehydrase and lipid transport
MENIMRLNLYKIFLVVTAVSSLCAVSELAMSVGRLSVTKEVSLKAKTDTVWKMIGGFNEFDVWHPIVVDSVLKLGEGVKPGDTRVLSLDNGSKITEKLVVYSNFKKTYTYAITKSSLPVMDYVSTITVSESHSGMSKVKWSSTFNANNASDDKAIETIASVYEAGLKNLEKHFNQ